MPTFVLLPVVLAMLLVGGCSSYEAKGNLIFAEDAPANVASDPRYSRIKSGPSTLEFAEKPLLLANEVVLENPYTRIEASVPRSAYGDRSFLVRGRDNALPFDIKVNWSEREGGKVERDERVDCSGPGYCSMPVSRRRCTTGSSGQRDCYVDTDYEYGHYYNCPGSKPVRNAYQVYRFKVFASLLQPAPDATPLANFEGETVSREEYVKTLREGRCGF